MITLHTLPGKVASQSAADLPNEDREKARERGGGEGGIILLSNNDGHSVTMFGE